NLQRSNTNNIPRYDRSTLPGPDKFDYAEWYYGPQLRSLAAYQVSIHSMPGFFNRLNAGINYQYSEESRHQRKFNSLNLDNRFEKVNSIGYTVTLQKITATHNLRLGTEGRIERLKSTAFRETINTHEKQPLDTRYPDGKNSMQFYALYATHTWKVTDKWILNDGLRFQTTHLYSEFVSRDFFPFPFTESSQRNSALTGSIGINFLPESDWKISTLISTGFRVPNVDNTGKVFDSQPGVLIVPNPNLKPEKTYNADFSIIKIFFEKIKWENTVFYTFYRNAIVLDRFQFSGNDSVFYDGEMSGVFASQNKRKAFITGFSSSLFAEITSSFSFRGTLS
ncbi:MAG: TonB-dependent receptor, partial [Chitinophagaceae bacterium]|nr:TonB-dependent receptor [Chitinophagaceae bacterium]